MTSTALLSQSKAIDSARLLRKIVMINKKDFVEIKNKIKEILSL